MYHSQMSNRAREESHRLFLRDELNVMVATIAFGMGIDKPNIRHVIHYGCPKSVESYYQESGRCGRDGIASVCWLYYTRSDFAKADFYCGESLTEIQRSAVRVSLMAAQRYCFLTTCRRKFLLQHFGEQSSYDNCGNCDNCTSSKRERDLSREAYLLMACIQSCGGHWGLNLPIDVLRGSRAKKILDARFDKLPLHGLGKDYPSNWWKELGYVLISQGYLQEIVKDVFKLVSVSPKGLQFLSSSRSDHQPPLLLPETSGMLDVMECKKASGGVEDDRSLVTLESEGFSEAEAKLYHMLLEERMKLARGIGTAPHAVCGDQTIKKIALARPSTKARLSNIDGVNQYLVATHGDHLLQTIRHLSQGLNLSLDGYEDVSIQNATTKKVYAGPNQEGKVAPVFSEAEGQLIQLLLEERMKIARGTGTSPHAICDDQTIRKIALTRPSTKARLANIDGVNQEFVASHGEHLLQIIKDLSQKLNLSLAGHGVSSIKTVTPRKVNQEGKIAPAKYEAWKMWNEGLPFKRIANHPSRGAPIKEETVINYLLNAAQEGLPVDWARLCDEVGMTRQKFSEIQAAISRIGSRDKLKPIKEELPEHISYVHIRVCLTMVDCGMSVDSISPSHYDTVDEEPCEVETTVEAAAELTPVSVNDDDPLFSRKRQKIDGPEEESSMALEATETSILDLLKNYEDGVSLSDIVEHFKGSKEERVVDLLECLESDFLIFKKKNRYRLM